jgi:hypothetical protein
VTTDVTQPEFQVPDVPDDGSWDDIVNPPSGGDGDKTYFGFLEFARQDVFLIKSDRDRGIKGGRVPFDKTIHPEEKRQINVAMKLTTLVGNNGQGGWEYNHDALNWAKEFKEITLPSLAAVGWDLRVKRSNWCQVIRKKFGEYTRDGEVEPKDKRIFQVVAIYPDEAACRAASDAFWESRRRGDTSDAPPVVATNGLGGATATTGVGDSAAKRTAALRFLRLTVKSAFPDWDALEAKLAVEPFKSAGVGPDSQEVLDEWEKLAVAEGA